MTPHDEHVAFADTCEVCWRELCGVPPRVDEEPWAVAEPDPLSPARGCTIGLVVGVVAWLIVALVVWGLTR